MLKIIFIIFMMSFTSSFSIANTNIQSECFVSGKVELPEHFYKKSKVNLLDQNSKIESDGFYCIKKAIRKRDQLYLTVVNKDKKVILRNPIFFNEGTKDGSTNITLERAFAEQVCIKRLCDEREIYLYEGNEYIIDYKKKLLKSFYSKNDNNSRFKYDKVLKKMKNQSYKVVRQESKVIQKNREEGFFPLENVRAKEYSKFKYSEYNKNKLISKYLNNDDVFVGLDNKNENSDIIILNWVRYIFYYGDQFEDVSALYSDNLRFKLYKNNDLEKPLILSKLYQSNARVNTFVREINDFKFYKKSIPDISKHFKQSGSIIVNEAPDYVNIEFIFEKGAWRLDVFNVNDEYYKYLDNL